MNLNTQIVHIKIFPMESAKFAETKASRKRNQEHKPQTMFLSSNNQARALTRNQNMRLVLFQLWQLHILTRVLREMFVNNRILESTREHRMHATNSRRSKTSINFFDIKSLNALACEAR